MTSLALVIGNKNYSSWSLRPWFLMTHSGIPFEEIRLPLDTVTFHREIPKYNAARRVPVLCHGDLRIVDSLAIAEYLAEQFPQSQLWPADRESRALARSVCAEMHSSFLALRDAMPMNCRAVGRRVAMDGAVSENIERIRTLWRECRERHADRGPWLFGVFSIADAFYAPVASRFRTYGVPCGEVEKAFVEHVLSQPAMRDWYTAAAAEPETIEHEEVGA